MEEAWVVLLEEKSIEMHEALKEVTKPTRVQKAGQRVAGLGQGGVEEDIEGVPLLSKS